ncbi:carnitine dehydratase [Novosphingobium malaysiense]|uniref:Carnitine dehydratase n=2 Tax=Novosphingobium malaysiense TaxID=1348853 RepID=A0A0B1ZH43_9SPHN|nr:carnitine dehydratase [Novosphingobium malaysiense]
MEDSNGPLKGIRIVELAGIGPAPFAGMMLADHGADIIRIDRPQPSAAFPTDILNRSRRSIILDLKHSEGVEAVRALCRTADGFIEGLRPGVTERLGIGPEVLLSDNPKLVYGRITGWGQTGPLAQAAGHDINYLALCGALHPMGKAGEKPPVPLNLVADFGGGGMMLAFSMLAALLAVRAGRPGQVIDAAMTEGAALLAATFFNPGQLAGLDAPRGRNMLGGGAPFYDTYETRDGEFIAIGAIEPQFYGLLLETTGLAGDPDMEGLQGEPERWSAAKAKLAAVFRRQDRAYWCAKLERSDACFAPVLSRREAPHHPQHLARGSFVEAFGVVQPGPAPRYSESRTRTPALRPPGADGEEILCEAGYSTEQIASLREAGVLL